MERLKLVGRNILELASKENKNFKYVFYDDDVEIFNILTIMILPKEPKKYFSLAYEYFKTHKSKIDGWNLYNPIKEYERQKINLIDKVFDVYY